MNKGMIRASVVKREQREDNNNDDRYEFSAEISNDLLDSYYTTMDRSTLRNFRDDSKSGVAFLEGHDTRRINLGRTFDARLNKLEDRQRVIADIFTVRDINFSSNVSFASTNDFIRSIEQELVADVSVGFYGGRWECDICQKELFDFWAWLGGRDEEEMCLEHWPGYTYEVEGRSELATATIKDANLSEVSVVYDGATPEAQIIRKARMMYERDMIDEEAVHSLNHFYNLRMAPEEWDRDRVPIIGVRRKSKEGGTSQMDLMEMINSASIEGLPKDTAENAVRWLIDKHGELEPKQKELQDRNVTLESENQTLKTANGDLESAKQLSVDLGKQVNVYKDENQELRDKVDTLETAREADKDISDRYDEAKTKNDELTEEVEQLTTKNAELQAQIDGSEKMVKLGEETRDGIIAQALEYGVGAYGTDFNAEEQKQVLENMELDMVRLTAKTWKKEADKRFPDPNKRKTQDGDPDPSDPPATREFTEPDIIYGIYPTIKS